MNRWLAAFLLLATLAALAFRLPSLDRRPMHNDEAVNAIVFQRLWEQGEYRYNPDEYHGPLLHYATLPFAWLGGEKDFDHLSERTLRWITVAAGLIVVLGVGLLHDALGARATAAAAALVACSPAMVFYSRYFIHEMLLVAASLLLLGGAWRYLRHPSPAWAATTGAALGLMYATKETFVLTLGALTLAAALTLLWNRRSPPVSSNASPAPSYPVTLTLTLPLPHLALALGVAATIGLLFFTSFGSHPRGALDSALTYLPWLKRAGGHSPHLHPWYFYLERLFWHQPPKSPLWTEAVIGALAVLGALTGCSRHHPCSANTGFARFLTVFTLGLTVLYSAIAYKTPWCLLNFLLPMILLAGLGAQALLRWPTHALTRLGAALLLAAGVAQLSYQAWRSSQGLTTHRANPYLYAQTVPNALELADRVKAIAHAAPQGSHTEIKVVAPESEYWPLPWYLRQLRTVWWLDQLHDPPFAPIMIVAAGLHAELDEKTGKRWLSVGYYELRPREFFELYVEFDLWKRYLETRPPPPEDP